MKTKLTIIATTNFSPTANNAVAYAAGLAQKTEAKLILFNSFSLSVHSSNAHITADAVQQQINRTILKLEDLAVRTAVMFKIETESICTYSFLEDELLRIIDDKKADVVVMGMAERTFEQELLGNSTTSVIKNLQIPVLAVPKSAKFLNIEKVLYACDSLSFSAIKRFSSFRRILVDFEAEIEFFSVEENLDTLKKERKRALENSNIDKEFEDVKYLYKTVRSNAVIDEIEKEIKIYHADLLIMVPQKYGFWDSLVHRSKTRVLASGLEIPLLSLPNY
ncbi:universal stress protein [Flavobacterium aquicola]|uniref:Nucleotide-binding universal stress UspA family protein n=1 Tax=Flavobacterium aquicola TaxID=1682742 RepID=A0A3E0ENZ1_9FLAO|nr:universal stress protein [Flavobacterium aquicola]REG99450.1 nucleotide-binding universal stress UspA family protein [Flavobacterium aquicola]